MTDLDAAIVIVRAYSAIDLRALKPRSISWNRVADRAGVDVQTIADWRLGRWRPRHENLLAVLQALRELTQ